MVMTEPFGNSICTEDGQEMGTSCNGIDVDDLVHRACSAMVTLKMNSPHSSVSIRLGNSMGYEPGDKGAREISMAIVE